MALVTKIDHVVVAAMDLQSGIDYIKEHLDVDIPPGGEHKTLGTHNHVMQLGNDTFLEVVAPSSSLPPPGRPRWFGLDDPYVQAQLQQSPALITWVVNTSDLAAARDLALHSIGHPVDLQRNNLSWTFSLPADGRLLACGMLPYIMQWHMDDHPSRNMADTGCKLAGIEIRHPNAAWIESALDAIGLGGVVSVSALPEGSAAQLAVTIDTPKGSRQLTSFVPG